MNKDDFSLEDNKEVVETFHSMASSEFERLKEKLKRDRRKEQLLYLRSLPRSERKALREKYGLAKRS